MPDVGVTRGTCLELKLDGIGRRVLILITIKPGNICVAGGVVRDPNERDTDEYQALNTLVSGFPV